MRRPKVQRRCSECYAASIPKKCPPPPHPKSCPPHPVGWGGGQQVGWVGGNFAPGSNNVVNTLQNAHVSFLGLDESPPPFKHLDKNIFNTCTLTRFDPLGRRIFVMFFCIFEFRWGSTFWVVCASLLIQFICHWNTYVVSRCDFSATFVLFQQHCKLVMFLRGPNYVMFSGRIRGILHFLVCCSWDVHMLMIRIVKFS